MAGERVVVQYHPATEILTVRYAQRFADDVLESEGDPCVLLEVDRHGFVVGLMLLDVSSLTTEGWRDHPGAVKIPDALRDAVAAWLQERG